MPKLSLLKNNSGNISPVAGGGEDFHSFPKCISLRVNVIAQLEFELTYFDVVVQYVNHYTTIDVFQ